MSNINELREQARRAHRNATRKVSRLKQAGVPISGTELDPRKPAAEIKRMNSRQLTSYNNKLSKFTARSSGYVPSADKPITRAQWREYKRLETVNNARARIREAMTSDIGLPGGDGTIGQRRADVTANRRAYGTATNKPLEVVFRQSKNIRGPAGLQKLIDNMKSKLTPDYVRDHVTNQRRQFNQMLDSIGDPKLAELAAQMTPGQFDLAWNEGGLANEASLSYATSDIEIGRAHDSIESDDNDGVYKWVEWALKIKA